MLWCSYFRSFIKSTNFSRMGNFVEKFNFVNTSWKIIILLGNSVGDHIWVIQIQIYNLAHLGGWGHGVVVVGGWVLWCWGGWPLPHPPTSPLHTYPPLTHYHPSHSPHQPPTQPPMEKKWGLNPYLCRDRFDRSVNL